MVSYYDAKVIPKILKTFKVNTIVISGLTNKKILSEIKEYKNIKYIDNNPLNELSNLKNYDAIFIDDDANWYTLFNELEIIKKTNENFPLVFICNNKFPNKYRDSYVNPDIIPKEFRQNFTTKLPICYKNKKIMISDGFYHACEENTSKNGVLTAIEDFILHNNQIGIMDIKFIEEITILYPKVQINQKRIDSIIKNNDKLVNININDTIIENQLLISYINKNNISNINLDDLEIEISKKDSIIKDYENKVKNHDNELNYKNSQIKKLKSEINLNDSQIKNIESKLVNKNNKINTLQDDLNKINSKLVDKNNKINTLQDDLNKINSKLVNKDNEISILNNKELELKNKINSLNQKIIDEKNLNEDKKSEIELLNKNLGEIKRLKIDVESKYKNELSIINSQINFLENNLAEKEDLFNQKESNLIDVQNKLKNSNEHIVSLNNELSKKEELFNKKELNLKNKLNDFSEEINNKNSKIEYKDNLLRNKQLELNNKEEELKSLHHDYIKQLSKIENKEYCISCFKDEISNNHAEIRYLKNNTFTKKILSPIGYLYLIFKSKPKEISLNLKLFKTLKESECFDIGFYLNNNKDLIKSKWCKYFSPELHYVCNGFTERRTFNKKYFNRTTKEDLLNYLLNCNK